MPSMEDAQSLNKTELENIQKTADIKHNARLENAPISTGEVPQKLFTDTRPDEEYEKVCRKVLAEVPKFLYRYEEATGHSFSDEAPLPDLDQPLWEDLKNVAYLTAHSIAPHVKIETSAFKSPTLTGHHIALLGGQKPTQIWYPEIDYDQGPSIGIEIEQTLNIADLDWISKVDKLWNIGIPVHEDGDREISPPPTQDPRILKEFYRSLEMYGYIKDENPNLHITIGGLEGADPVDILYLNLALSCTGGSAFRSISPNVHGMNDLVAIPNVTSKSLFEEFIEAAETDDYQIRFRANGSIEFRSLFWPQTDTNQILNGIDSIFRVSQMLQESIRGDSTRWNDFVERTSTEIAKAAGVEKQDLLNHLSTHISRVNQSMGVQTNENASQGLDNAVTNDKLALSRDPQVAYSGHAYSTLCGILGTLAFDNQNRLGQSIQHIIDET